MRLRVQRPLFKDIALATIALVAFLGLLGLSFIDADSRQAFLNMATFTIGATVGYFVPESK